MNKYHIVFSVDIMLGVRFIDVWANSILEAVRNARQQLSDIDNIKIIQCKQISLNN